MTDFANEVAELEAILHDYTVFFIIFDVVFTVMLFLGVILGIKFIKSKKKLLESNEYLSYTIHGQEEERSRIARELHDTVAQDLRYCKNLSEKADAAEHLKEISALLEKSMLQVRSMSYHLSPPDITKRNFAENLKNLCAEFAEIGTVDFRLSILDGTDTSFLTEDDNLHLYRIVQESFTNALKHAEASEVVVLVRNGLDGEEKGLHIFITDDGKGFDVQQKFPRGAKHFGLAGMKKRADLIGATLEISSEKGEGTQISIMKRNITIQKDYTRGGVQ